MANSGISLKIFDAELITCLKGNDSERKKGENQLFADYQYFIKEGERKYKLTHEEIFDAYVDAVIVVIEKIRNGSFKGLSTIKTYLFQVFQNKCVDLLRKKTTNKQSVHQTGELTGLLSQLSDSAKSIIIQLMENTDFDILKQRLEQLGDNCRQLLLLWADGFSDKEIVRQFAYKTPDVVKTTRLRCIDKLRQSYGTKKD
jgi:RNA polymerase sigma factor (sigma-70 family)